MRCLQFISTAILLITMSAGPALVCHGQAEDPNPAPDDSPQKPVDETEPSAEQQARYRKLEELLTGAKLVGEFTVLGSDRDKRSPEEYTIRSIKKAPLGDYWLIVARIKYGGKDVTIPLPPIEIKWAGDTPMISVTDYTIPLMGTFHSRVFFYNNKYAGTWAHGDVGGHLFGVIEKPENEAGE